MLESNILSIRVSRLRRLLVIESCSRDHNPKYKSANQIPITILRQRSRFATSEHPMAKAHNAKAADNGSLCQVHLPRQRMTSHQIAPAAKKTNVAFRYCGVNKPSPVHPTSAP